MECGFVTEGGHRARRRHVEVQYGGNAGLARDRKGLANRLQRYLGHLGAEALSAANELRVVRANVLGRSLLGRARGHVDGSLARIVDEDLRQGARRPIEKDVVIDSRPVHRLAQETPPLIIALSSRETQLESEQGRPSHLVEEHAAHELSNRTLSLNGAHHALLVGPENARYPVHAVHRHASDPHDIELSPRTTHSQSPAIIPANRWHRVGNPPPHRWSR